MRVRAGLLFLAAAGGEGCAAVRAAAGHPCARRAARARRSSRPSGRIESLSGCAVSRGDDSAVFGGAAEAVEHAPGLQRNLADRLFPVALVAQKRGHHANHVGTAFDKDDAGIIAHGFQFAGLVGDLEVGGQIARDEGTLFVLSILKKSAVDSLFKTLP